MPTARASRPGRSATSWSATCCRELAFAAADPSATVEAIRQAIAIERVDRRSTGLRGEALGRAQVRVEGLALGPPAGRPGVRDAVLAPLARRARRRPGILPLTLAVPLAPGREPPPSARLAEALRALPDTHVARLSRIPRTMQDHLGQLHPDRLPVDYLLLTTDHDGEPAPYAEAVRTQAGDAADTLFGACAAYPGAADARGFRAWMDRHRLRTDYTVTGHPPRTVAELDRLVGDRARIARWTLEGPLPPPRGGPPMPPGVEPGEVQGNVLHAYGGGLPERALRPPARRAVGGRRARPAPSSRAGSARSPSGAGRPGCRSASASPRT